MHHQLTRALALSLSLGSALPSAAQLPSPAQPTAPAQIALFRPPDHSIQLPLTTQSTFTYIQTSPDGHSTRQKEVNLTVSDAQGRRSTANTVLGSNLTLYTVDDPIAATRFVWSSAGKLAKALPYPEPVPGRKSCWKLPPAEEQPRPGELQLNLTGTTCMPADYPLQQPPFCTSEHLPTSSARDFPLVDVTTPSCASLLPGQPFDDLGTKSIRGFTAQGCRTTAPATSQTTDTWSIQLTSGTLSATVTVSSLVETQAPNQQDLQTLQDLTILKVIEPDPSTFRPPPGYTIQTIAMHEVPCPPALPPE